MLFWTCCAPAAESIEPEYDIILSEDLAYQVSENRYSPNPTLLSSQRVLHMIEEETKEQGPIDFDRIEAKGARGLPRIAEEAKEEEIASGRRCMQLSESTGAQRQAEYFVETGSKELVVKLIRQAGQPETVVCPIMLIEDIFTIDDGEDAFPTLVMKSLVPAEKRGLFMIVFTTDDPSAEPTKLCLVEESWSARDFLLDRLRDLVCSY